jgi:RNA polymerase sigma-70 factor (ECF subfamily)
MDPSRLERELEELHPASFAWAVSCCGGDRQEAEDVLQTVYVKILSGKARFGGRSSLKTWVFSVIRRTAWASSRKRRLRAALRTRWMGNEARVVEARGEERLDRRRRAGRVRAALERLSPRQRQILELVFYHGLTVREAGEALGVSAGTASLHYARGKQRLSSLMVERATGEGSG